MREVEHISIGLKAIYVQNCLYEEDKFSYTVVVSGEYELFDSFF